MIAVVAVIAVLVGAFSGLARAVHARAAAAQARSEIAVLSMAVESWCARYGAYPDGADASAFLGALTGRLGPQGSVLNPPGPAFIETARFRLQETDPEAAGNVILDPWDQPYHYVRFDRPVGGGSTLPGFLVFSGGPDGCVKPDDPPASGEAAGVPDLTSPENIDNIYSDR